MESDDRVELARLAIQKLVQEKRSTDLSSAKDDDDDRLLISSLLSQSESLKEDGTNKKTGTSVNEVETKAENAGEVNSDYSKIGAEEIVEELRKVRRQNTITHWLLSAMIVLTLAWQLSEVSLILKVKDRVSHPFRSFGSMLTGMLKGPGNNGQDAEKESSTKQNPTEVLSSVSPMKMPELPHMDLPHLGLNCEK